MVGGMAVGALVTVPVVLGYSALRAQTGDYIWNSHESIERVATVGGVMVALYSGVAIGAHDRFSTGDALLGGLVGGAAGALVGRGVTQFTSSTSPGRWAGTMVGAGAGALVGSIWAAVARSTQGEDTPVPLVTLRAPVSLPVLGR